VAVAHEAHLPIISKTAEPKTSLGTASDGFAPSLMNDNDVADFTVALLEEAVWIVSRDRRKNPLFGSGA
jgi:hypothetical protein